MDISTVYFVDVAQDANLIAYVVASSFWKFLTFLLNDELFQNGWPFKKDYVISIDPDIVTIVDAPLPWDA